MSHFTSVKIKINENNHHGTLLAEYGGDFEIKVWILDENDAWTGELSSVEAQEFISRYKIAKESFIEELERALTSSDPDVLYSIDKKDDKPYMFSWKKRLNTGITIKNGEISIEKVSRNDIYDEVLERSFEHNSQLHSRIEFLQKEKVDLLKQKEEASTHLKNVVSVKEKFEENVYSQFLSVLNAKKEKIAELQKEIDLLATSQSRGTSSKEEVENAVKKEGVTQKASRNRSLRNVPIVKKEEEREEEVNPFEVDTDVEEEDIPDVRSPLRSERESSEVQSQSFSMDSFDTVSSPVVALPKRVKNPKESPCKKMKSEKDLLDEL